MTWSILMTLMATERPVEAGFFMPSEWAPHAATWMSWPFDDEIWFGHLREVREEYAALVRAVASAEPVHLLVRDEEAEASAQKALQGLASLTLHRVPLNDVWLRDNGAIFVKAPTGGELRAVNWRFNAWGGKYPWDLDDRVGPQMAAWARVARYDAPWVMEGGSIDVNGDGVALTTEQCLLTPTRNPRGSRADLEGALRDYLGIRQVIWLRQGLEGDHTDGHIDTITRFAPGGRILTSVTSDVSDPNHQAMQENLQILKDARQGDGRPWEIVPLPLPANRIFLEDGTRLAPSYANFYICNKTVLVPQYEDPHDQEALKVIQSVFPDHKVQGLASRFIIMGGGSFHCLTQQEPA